MTQWPTQAEAAAFYSPMKIVLVTAPWPLLSEGKPHGPIEIHEKCADSLRRVLANVWNDVGQSLDKIKELHYDIFDGSYVVRPIRGGTHPSMHSYGCAIDWDAAHNEHHSTHHLFTEASPLVIRFKEEGAIWGGNWGVKDIDAMHFQFARVR